ncbi:alcohol dehydrogenase catalytic domain-containing protein [Kribbella yunnanensis]|uniref:alcohol dehydrogenase catalytic domain-containing protein n=1 Tax=Kribbella yunnanensis TaxID=190194 RepID=UPI0031E0AF4B
MKALTWQGKRKIEYGEVPDPRIEDPTDAVIKVTSTGICGSDLHLYEVMSPFLDAGDVLGHESIGIVEEVGSAVTSLSVGDRVVVPFQIACGSCFMCNRNLQTQCETTQVREQGMGAALFGYTKLYGAGPRRPGRIPSRSPGAVRADQGAARSAGRSFRLPVRRAADRLAGGPVRRDPGRRHGRRTGAWSDR